MSINDRWVHQLIWYTKTHGFAVWFPWFPWEWWWPWPRGLTDLFPSTVWSPRNNVPQVGSMSPTWKGTMVTTQPGGARPGTRWTRFGGIFPKAGVGKSCVLRVFFFRNLRETGNKPQQQGWCSASLLNKIMRKNCLEHDSCKGAVYNCRLFEGDKSTMILMLQINLNKLSSWTAFKCNWQGRGRELHSRSTCSQHLEGCFLCLGRA